MMRHGEEQGQAERRNWSTGDNIQKTERGFVMCVTFSRRHLNGFKESIGGLDDCKSGELLPG